MQPLQTNNPFLLNQDAVSSFQLCCDWCDALVLPRFKFCTNFIFIEVNVFSLKEMWAVKSIFCGAKCKCGYDGPPRYLWLWPLIISFISLLTLSMIRRLHRLTWRLSGGERARCHKVQIIIIIRPIWDPIVPSIYNL